jgi:hypothetical protein
MAKELRVDHGPVDPDLTLTEEEKVWLRNWNRADEIPGEGDADGSDAGDDDDEEGDEYDDMLADDLKEELRKRDLPVSGNKDELIARLREDDESDEDDEE